MSDNIFKAPGISRAVPGKACAWYEKVVIPTYGTGKPEKNPVFLEKRVYQGSSGVVYPHPVVEKIQDEKSNREWNAIFLENHWLKIMILPELGGRIQMAYDKTMQRHFVYYNQVIKPALVGLTGPWISGGIEFNWPQHHRPSTFEPVDHYIGENSDGSVTVWCSEVERMFRTRGSAGFTLYPDKAYLEIRVKLFNRTDVPQTFLWWANPAVKVNDHYQSVFPPDVHAVFDHGKRDVSEFPIARGTYYKVDYSPGTDISRYRNIPVPTSYMAINSACDFVGGYEHDTGGGLLHIANHHVSPGKKQWTWGHSDFGVAWDRNLTDEDGPYIELMCGVYTDNQPDFSWLMPGEEKSFSQYFMPYSGVGLVKNATLDAMVNLETEAGRATIKAYATAIFKNTRIFLITDRKVIFSELSDFEPGKSYEKNIALPRDCDPEGLTVTLVSAEGKVLVEYSNRSEPARPVPEPARAAKDPAVIDSVEQLYLTGLHLEQYRHATYDARDYYREALRRDPAESRVNNAMGLWHLRRGSFEEAEAYFRKSVETLTERNPNPADGEPFYNLGLALRYQERDAEAFGAFYKAVWNAAWQENGYFQLARIAAAGHRYEEALELIDRSLIRNWHNQKTRQLKTALLRKLGKTAEAMQLANDSLALDPFSFGMLYDKSLLSPEDEKALPELTSRIRGNLHTYIEFALDYAWAGMFDEAKSLVNMGIIEQEDHPIYPLALYYKAWFEMKAGRDYADTLHRAADACPDYCFPNQTEAVPVLTWAIHQNKSDYKALYYLGNFWYNARNYDKAIDCWEKAVSLKGGFPTVRRNLALALFNKRNDAENALRHLEAAFSADTSDARILMELDQLYKRLKRKPEARLAFLEKYPEQVNERDDLYLERATLYNLLGEYRTALDLILSRKFHPWEGGEGKVTGQYVTSLTELAKLQIRQGHPEEAVNLLLRSLQYPTNLGEGKLYGALENEQYFWLGVAYRQTDDPAKAASSWETASGGMEEPSAANFYNDQQPDTLFYRGLALSKLRREEEAHILFNKLIDFGVSHENDTVKVDYFAVSLPDLLIWEDDLGERNRILCKYLRGLGEWGMGNYGEATRLLEEVCRLSPSHGGGKIHLQLNEYVDLIK